MLIVDDDPVFLTLVRVVLSEQCDVEVVGEAASGWEALVQAKAVKPDVVIMDVEMPVMDGIEATRVLTRAQPSPRVIVLTGGTTPEAENRARAAGAEGYLHKTDLAGLGELLEATATG